MEVCACWPGGCNRIELIDMADLRDMELLASLARHSHFARAADECGISQPAFSARIRNLETELGIPIVKRGNRFLGFTAEGQIVLKWARRILADSDGLRQEVEAAKGALSGELAIGAVPTALVFAARALSEMRVTYPGLVIQLQSLTASQVQRGLEDLSIDAGLTYLDGNLPAHLDVRPLYEERYVLVAPEELAPRASGTATWREAAGIPLCLLTPDMRNRRILDAVFKQVIGVAPQPVLETNAFTAALAQVAGGGAATIAPALLLESLPMAQGAACLALVDPEVTTSIGLVVADRDPTPPAVLALIEALTPVPR